MTTNNQLRLPSDRNQGMQVIDLRIRRRRSGSTIDRQRKEDRRWQARPVITLRGSGGANNVGRATHRMPNKSKHPLAKGRTWSAVRQGVQG